MKRKLFILVALALALCLFAPGQSYAARGDREALNYGYVDHASSASDIALVGKPCYLYAATIYPSEGKASVLIYDSSSSTLQDKGVAAEITESAAYATTREVFDPPIRMSEGVYVDVTQAKVVIEYR